MQDDVVIHEGDCLSVLPTLPDASIDCVITDPPYPCIKRSYGVWTEEEWWALMVEGVIPQVRRVLKPTGSAVFILQPNSRKVGSMRGWLWEFMAWCCREWNMVQDAWWWNTEANTTIHVHQNINLLRPSVKPLVWCGPESCWRDQSEVLWEESDSNRMRRLQSRVDNRLQNRPSGYTCRDSRQRGVAAIRGGVTPFNLLPIGGGGSVGTAGAHGHGAGTPLELARWWTRYICPPGGVVLDPFLGSGTMALGALKEGRRCIGIERMPEYVEIARKRVAELNAETPLFTERS